MLSLIFVANVAKKILFAVCTNDFPLRTELFSILVLTFDSAFPSPNESLIYTVFVANLVPTNTSSPIHVMQCCLSFIKKNELSRIKQYGLSDANQNERIVKTRISACFVASLATT